MKTHAVETQQHIRVRNKWFITRLTLLMILAFLLPQTKILGGISPFFIALIAALPLHYAVMCTISSIIGLLTQGINQQFLIYLIITLVILGSKILFQRYTWSNQLIFCSGLTVISFLWVHLMAAMILQMPTMDIILRICESIIAGTLTSFLHLSCQVLLKKKPLIRCNQFEIYSIGIMLMLGVLALAPIQLYQLNLGLIFGIMCLHVLINRLKLVGGCIGSILLSFSLCLYSLNFLTVCTVLVISSFLTGLFTMGGKYVQAGVFIAVSIFSVFVMGMNLTLLFSILQIVIASILYLSLSDKLFQWVRFPALTSFSFDPDMVIRQTLEHRLSFAAHTIQELKYSVQQVAKTVDSTMENVDQLYHQTARNVCQHCELKLICWDEHYHDTVEGFQKLYQQVQCNHLVTGEDVKALPQINCCRSSILAHTIQQNYIEYQNKQKTSRYLGELRGIATEQLAGVSQLLWEVSEEVANIKTVKPEIALLISQVVETLSEKPDSVCCMVNSFHRMEIDIHATSTLKIDLKELGEELSSLLKRDFALPVMVTVANKMRISVYEKPTYLLEQGMHQMSYNGKDICGDSCGSFVDNKGYAYLMISDGMGNGKNAAIDSTMTCGVMVKLLKAGFGMDSIMKFVNSCLQIKSQNESLATIDIVKIDLFTGETVFFKAGSASSYLMMNHTFAKIDTQSLPVGILQGIEFDKKTYLLHDGDMIVLLSDGVMELGEKIILQELKRCKHLSCETLSAHLCKKASNTLNKHDDLTVIIAKIITGV